MKEKTYLVTLSYEELLLLDQKNIQEKTQNIINEAKEEHEIKLELPLMRSIILQSTKNGEISWRRTSEGKQCSNCRKDAGYYPYQRDSLYHKRGEPNYDNPRTLRGLNFNEGFIRYKGSLDFCSECCEKYNVEKTLINYILDNDLKIEIKNTKCFYDDIKIQSKYEKDPIRICYKCNSEIYESNMGESRTLFGDGFYKSTCPNCGTSSTFMQSHKHTSKFRMNIKKEENKNE